MVKKTLSNAKMEKEKKTRNEKWRSKCGMMKNKNEQAKKIRNDGNINRRHCLGEQERHTVCGRY